MNPCAPPPPPPSPSPNPNLSATLSSLNKLLSLSNDTLPLTPSPPNLTTNLIQCPFNPHHLLPPHSLFLHHLRCSSSPRPIPNHLLHSLTYPNTLHTPPSHSLSLEPYLDFAFNFFYRHCPGIVTFSDAHSLNTTLTLPSVLSLECANSKDTIINDDLSSESRSVCSRILPSEYCAIKRELESWKDFPAAYSNCVLRAILGLGIAKERDLMTWIITNSPQYGVVIDTPTQKHIFLLCCLCFKAVLREALVSSTEKRNLRPDCPVLNEALTWLQSQVSILYGAPSGKFFVLDFVKSCVLVGASGLLLFPFGKKVTAEACDSEKESKDLDNSTKPDGGREEETKCIVKMKIFGSQVAAAVAALHERSLLEREIWGIWLSQQPTKHQLVAEQCYFSERASEERKKRLDYRPVIDHDVLLRQKSANQDASREKTREELLAEERERKRRRKSYRGKKKPSALQVLRDTIDEYMEEIKQAADVEDPLNVSDENGIFPSKHPSGHDIPAVTVANSSYNEQQSRTKYCDKTEPGEDTLSRSPGGRTSDSRSHEHNIHHKKRDHSNRNKYHGAASMHRKKRIDL